jgi:cyclopropane-fatty-acyl-phospholipid synthase
MTTLPATNTETSPEIQATRHVLRALFGPPQERSFAIRLWDGTTEMPADGRGRFTLVLSEPGALRRMFLPPSELAIVEAYISGAADIEGNMELAAELPDLVARHMGSPGTCLRLLRSLLALPSAHETHGGTLRAVHHLWRHGTPHTPTRDAQVVQFHYNVGNDFYALWLDRRMVYSCAYFEPGVDDLDTAQEAKLDLICRKLRLAPGEQLLDIGCGWGGLICYAAERYGVNALGITLSEPQAEEARTRIAAAGLSARCHVEVRDYRDLADTQRFDKIVSVGMVEHVGHDKLPVYFATAHRALKPGGLFLNHGIISLHDARPTSVLDTVAAAVWKRDAFVQRYVFPDGRLLPFADVVAAAEGVGFETRDVESLREHYMKTLRHWVARLEAQAAEAIRLVGEPTYRVWRLYMSASAHAFATAGIGVVQTLFVKPDAAGGHHLPPTRQDIYCR